MQIAERDSGPVTILDLSGKLVLGDGGDTLLKDKLHSLLHQGKKNLVLNLAQVPVPEGAQFFTMSDTLRFAFDPARVFTDSGVIVFCTTAVSLIPSFKAARMKPVAAMSHI